LAAADVCRKRAQPWVAGDAARQSVAERRIVAALVGREASRALRLRSNALLILEFGKGEHEGGATVALQLDDPI
jgi:hypothetical protein